jgi:hypothetical protein
MAERVLLVTYDGKIDADSLPTHRDARLACRVLLTLGLAVEVVSQQIFNPISADYMLEPAFERYSGIVYVGRFGFWDFTELIASRRPFLTTAANSTIAFGLGNGERDCRPRDLFNIIYPSHPIVRGLTPGSIDIGDPIEVDSVWTLNKKVDVIIEGETGDDVLVTHQEKRYAYFGFYRLSRAGGEADVEVLDLFRRTVSWLLD